MTDSSEPQSEFADLEDECAADAKMLQVSAICNSEALNSTLFPEISFHPSSIVYDNVLSKSSDLPILTSSVSRNEVVNDMSHTEETEAKDYPTQMDTVNPEVLIDSKNETKSNQQMQLSELCNEASQPREWFDKEDIETVTVDIESDPFQILSSNSQHNTGTAIQSEEFRITQKVGLQCRTSSTSKESSTESSSSSSELLVENVNLEPSGELQTFDDNVIIIDSSDSRVEENGGSSFSDTSSSEGEEIAHLDIRRVSTVSLPEYVPNLQPRDYKQNDFAHQMLQQLDISSVKKTGNIEDNEMYVNELSSANDPKTQVENLAALECVKKLSEPSEMNSESDGEEFIEVVDMPSIPRISLPEIAPVTRSPEYKRAAEYSLVQSDISGSRVSLRSQVVADQSDVSSSVPSSTIDTSKKESAFSTPEETNHFTILAVVGIPADVGYKNKTVSDVLCESKDILQNCNQDLGNKFPILKKEAMFLKDLHFPDEVVLGTSTDELALSEFQLKHHMKTLDLMSDVAKYDLSERALVKTTDLEKNNSKMAVAGLKEEVLYSSIPKLSELSLKMTREEDGPLVLPFANESETRSVCLTPLTKQQIHEQLENIVLDDTAFPDFVPLENTGKDRENVDTNTPQDGMGTTKYMPVIHFNSEQTFDNEMCLTYPKSIPSTNESNQHIVYIPENTSIYMTEMNFPDHVILVKDNESVYNGKWQCTEANNINFTHDFQDNTVETFNLEIRNVSADKSVKSEVSTVQTIFPFDDFTEELVAVKDIRATMEEVQQISKILTIFPVQETNTEGQRCIENKNEYQSANSEEVDMFSEEETSIKEEIDIYEFEVKCIYPIIVEETAELHIDNHQFGHTESKGDGIPLNSNSVLCSLNDSVETPDLFTRNNKNDEIVYLEAEDIELKHVSNESRKDVSVPQICPSNITVASNVQEGTSDPGQFFIETTCKTEVDDSAGQKPYTKELMDATETACIYRKTTEFTKIETIFDLEATEHSGTCIEPEPKESQKHLLTILGEDVNSRQHIQRESKSVGYTALPHRDNEINEEGILENILSSCFEVKDVKSDIEQHRIEMGVPSDNSDYAHSAIDDDVSTKGNIDMSFHLEQRNLSTFMSYNREASSQSENVEEVIEVYENMKESINIQDDVEISQPVLYGTNNTAKMQLTEPSARKGVKTELKHLQLVHDDAAGDSYQVEVMYEQGLFPVVQPELNQAVTIFAVNQENVSQQTSHTFDHTQASTELVIQEMREATKMETIFDVELPSVSKPHTYGERNMETDNSHIEQCMPSTSLNPENVYSKVHQILDDEQLIYDINETIKEKLQKDEADIIDLHQVVDIKDEHLISEMEMEWSEQPDISKKASKFNSQAKHVAVSDSEENVSITDILPSKQVLDTTSKTEQNFQQKIENVLYYNAGKDIFCTKIQGYAESMPQENDSDDHKPLCADAYQHILLSRDFLDANLYLPSPQFLKAVDEIGSVAVHAKQNASGMDFKNVEYTNYRIQEDNLPDVEEHMPTELTKSTDQQQYTEAIANKIEVENTLACVSVPACKECGVGEYTAISSSDETNIIVIGKEYADFAVDETIHDKKTSTEERPGDGVGGSTLALPSRLIKGIKSAEKIQHEKDTCASIEKQQNKERVKETFSGNVNSLKSGTEVLDYCDNRDESEVCHGETAFIVVGIKETPSHEMFRPDHRKVEVMSTPAQHRIIKTTEQVTSCDTLQPSLTTHSKASDATEVYQYSMEDVIAKAVESYVARVGENTQSSLFARLLKYSEEKNKQREPTEDNVSVSNDAASLSQVFTTRISGNDNIVSGEHGEPKDKVSDSYQESGYDENNGKDLEEGKNKDVIPPITYNETLAGNGEKEKMPTTVIKSHESELENLQIVLEDSETCGETCPSYQDNHSDIEDTSSPINIGNNTTSNEYDELPVLNTSENVEKQIQESTVHYISQQLVSNHTLEDLLLGMEEDAFDQLYKRVAAEEEFSNDMPAGSGTYQPPYPPPTPFSDDEYIMTYESDISAVERPTEQKTLENLTEIESIQEVDTSLRKCHIVVQEEESQNQNYSEFKSSTTTHEQGELRESLPPVFEDVSTQYLAVLSISDQSQSSSCNEVELNIKDNLVVNELDVSCMLPNQEQFEVVFEISEEKNTEVNRVLTVYESSIGTSSEDDLLSHEDFVSDLEEDVATEKQIKDLTETIREFVQESSNNNISSQEEAKIHKTNVVVSDIVEHNENEEDQPFFRNETPVPTKNCFKKNVDIILEETNPSIKSSSSSSRTSENELSEWNIIYEEEPKQELAHSNENMLRSSGEVKLSPNKPENVFQKQQTAYLTECASQLKTVSGKIKVADTGQQSTDVVFDVATNVTKEEFVQQQNKPVMREIISPVIREEPVVTWEMEMACRSHIESEVTLFPVEYESNEVVVDVGLTPPLELPTTPDYDTTKVHTNVLPFHSEACLESLQNLEKIKPPVPEEKHVEAMIILKDEQEVAFVNYQLQCFEDQYHVAFVKRSYDEESVQKSFKCEKYQIEDKGIHSDIKAMLASDDTYKSGLLEIASSSETLIEGNEGKNWQSSETLVDETEAVHEIMEIQHVKNDNHDFDALHLQHIYLDGGHDESENVELVSDDLNSDSDISIKEYDEEPRVYHPRGTPSFRDQAVYLAKEDNQETNPPSKLGIVFDKLSQWKKFKLFKETNKFQKHLMIGEIAGATGESDEEVTAVDREAKIFEAESTSVLSESPISFLNASSNSSSDSEDKDMSESELSPGPKRVAEKVSFGNTVIYEIPHREDSEAYLISRHHKMLRISHFDSIKVMPKLPTNESTRLTRAESQELGDVIAIKSAAAEGSGDAIGFIDSSSDEETVIKAPTHVERSYFAPLAVDEGLSDYSTSEFSDVEPEVKLAPKPITMYIPAEHAQGAVQAHIEKEYAIRRFSNEQLNVTDSDSEGSTISTLDEYDFSDINTDVNNITSNISNLNSKTTILDGSLSVEVASVEEAMDMGDEFFVFSSDDLDHTRIISIAEPAILNNTHEGLCEPVKSFVLHLDDFASRAQTSTSFTNHRRSLETMEAAFLDISFESTNEEAETKLGFSEISTALQNDPQNSSGSDSAILLCVSEVLHDVIETIVAQQSQDCEASLLTIQQESNSIVTNSPEAIDIGDNNSNECESKSDTLTETYRDDSSEDNLCGNIMEKCRVEFNSDFSNLSLSNAAATQSSTTSTKKSGKDVFSEHFVKKVGRASTNQDEDDIVATVQEMLHELVASALDEIEKIDNDTKAEATSLYHKHTAPNTEPKDEVEAVQLVKSVLTEILEETLIKPKNELPEKINDTALIDAGELIPVSSDLIVKKEIAHVREEKVILQHQMIENVLEQQDVHSKANILFLSSESGSSYNGKKQLSVSNKGIPAHDILTDMETAEVKSLLPMSVVDRLSKDKSQKEDCPHTNQASLAHKKPATLEADLGAIKILANNLEGNSSGEFCNNLNSDNTDEKIISNIASQESCTRSDPNETLLEMPHLSPVYPLEHDSRLIHENGSFPKRSIVQTFPRARYAGYIHLDHEKGKNSTRIGKYQHKRSRSMPNLSPNKIPQSVSANTAVQPLPLKGQKPDLMITPKQSSFSTSVLNPVSGPSPRCKIPVPSPQKRCQHLKQYQQQVVRRMKCARPKMTELTFIAPTEPNWGRDKHVSNALVNGNESSEISVESLNSSVNDQQKDVSENASNEVTDDNVLNPITEEDESAEESVTSENIAEWFEVSAEESSHVGLLLSPIIEEQSPEVLASKCESNLWKFSDSHVEFKKEPNQNPLLPQCDAPEKKSEERRKIEQNLFIPPDSDPTLSDLQPMNSDGTKAGIKPSECLNTLKSEKRPLHPPKVIQPLCHRIVYDDSCLKLKCRVAGSCMTIQWVCSNSVISESEVTELKVHDFELHVPLEDIGTCKRVYTLKAQNAAGSVTTQTTVHAKTGVFLIFSVFMYGSLCFNIIVFMQFAVL